MGCPGRTRGARAPTVQGDLLHWCRLLDAFDAFLEQHAACRPDVQLEAAAPAAPFPSAAVLAVLGATATIFENCSSNKQVYGSFDVSGASCKMGVGDHGTWQRHHLLFEVWALQPVTRFLVGLGACLPTSLAALVPMHAGMWRRSPCRAPQHLTSLLAAPDPEVVGAVLATLTAFLKKPHHLLMRWQATGQLTARLLQLCRGWGGKEEVGGGVWSIRFWWWWWWWRGGCCSWLMAA
jgi:hypothetical protein